MVSLQIGPISVTRGEEGRHFSVARPWRLPYGGSVSIPVYAFGGNRDGPVLAVVGGQHGNELKPINVLRHFIQRGVPASFAGVIVVIPVANPLAVADGTRCTVIDGTSGNGGDLNRMWPGKEGGFITQRIAAWLWEHIISKADYLIDMHDGTERIGIYYSYVIQEPTTKTDHESNRMAAAFGQEVLMHDPRVRGALTTQAWEAGIPAMACEVGDFYGIRRPQEGTGEPKRSYLEVGLRGILNLMQTIGMTEGEAAAPEYQVAVGPETGIGPAEGGLLEPRLSARDIGTVVSQGTVLGRILDPYSFDEIEVLTAPYAETLLLAAPRIDPFAMTFPGGGDFGYYVADWASRKWIRNKEGFWDDE